MTYTFIVLVCEKCGIVNNKKNRHGLDTQTIINEFRAHKPSAIEQSNYPTRQRCLDKDEYNDIMSAMSDRIQTYAIFPKDQSINCLSKLN
jgi:hypothetical protein